MTAEQMKLIKDKFVPYAPRWGSSGYASQDKWWMEHMGDVQTRTCRVGGAIWCIVTANGTPVVTPKGTVEGALEAYAKLPEKDRKPTIEDRGPYNPNLDFYADHPVPPGATVISVYCRPLESGSKGEFRAAKQVDASEFGAKGAYTDYSEPQREALWLTTEETQTFVPANAKKGDTFPVPPAIRQRMFLFYLYNWFAQSGGGCWAPKHYQSGTLTLTVEEVSSESVRLRLRGGAQFKAEFPTKSLPPEGHQTGLPAKYEMTYDARLFGSLEYDRAKKRFSRFDAVAVGDYRGLWQSYTVKVKPVPVGFAFQLDPRELPPERRHAPWALSAWQKSYWAADRWNPRD